MKHFPLLTLLLLFTTYTFAQKPIPAPVSPCQKLDTGTIKNLIIGTWIDVKDSTHIITVTYDSVEETVVIQVGGRTSRDKSYWNYRFTDNIFSTDAVTCYTLLEYLPDYPGKEKVAINYIDSDYMLLGAEGKVVFKRKR